MLLFLSPYDLLVSADAVFVTQLMFASVSSPAMPLWLTLSALVLFLYMGYTDAVSLRLPNKGCLLLFALGLVSLAKGCGAFPADLFAGASLAVPMALTDLIKRGSFGMGDIKLCLSAGPLLGWEGVFFGGLYGLVGAGFYGAGLLLLHQKGEQDVFPLGPFLLAGFAVMLVFPR